MSDDIRTDKRDGHRRVDVSSLVLKVKSIIIIAKYLKSARGVYIFFTAFFRLTAFSLDKLLPLLVQTDPLQALPMNQDSPNSG